MTVLFGSALPGYGRSPEIRTWLCYYGNIFGAEHYSKFDLVVLDGGNPPPLQRSAPGRPLLLGYLSVGEINVSSPHWGLAEGQRYLVRENSHWKSWLVDVRSRAWEDLLFDHAVPAIMEKGFDGVFLDTLDSSLSLETGEDREEFSGATAALIRLIKQMKERQPDMLVAVNRGLPILPEIIEDIDFLVVEGLYSSLGDEENGYAPVEESTRATLMEQVQKGLDINPDVPVLTIDYVSIDQPVLKDEAIAFSRDHGFVPYISTQDLNDIYYYTLDY